MIRLPDLITKGPADGREYAVPVYQSPDLNGVIIDMLHAKPLDGAAPTPIPHRTRDAAALDKRISRMETTMRNLRARDDEVSSGNVEFGWSNFGEPPGDRRTDNRGRDDDDPGQPVATLSPEEYSWEVGDDGSLRIYKRSNEAPEGDRRTREGSGRTDDAQRSPWGVLDVNGEERESHPRQLDRMQAAFNTFWKKAAS